MTAFCGWARPERALVGLLLFTSLNAIGGGLYGLGGADAVPREWLVRSPFADYRVPSMILMASVGGSHMLAAHAVWRNHKAARQLGQLAAAILAGWIIVQVWMIGFVSWLQPFMLVVAVAELLLAVRLPGIHPPSALNTHFHE